MKDMKVKKIISIFSIILLFLLIINIFTGCIQKDSKTEEKDTKLLSKQKYDKESVLPDWKDGDYHDHSSMTKLIKNYEKKYPGLIDVFSIGKSVEDRDIWCVKLTNEKNLQDKYVGVIDGGIHGNEWESTELCLYFIEYIIVNFGENNTLTEMCNSTELYFVPMLNPDGREVDSRYNANGIDLNRNFDVHFGRILGGSFRLGKLFGIFKIPLIKLPNHVFTNAGRCPFSEPETSALRDLLDSIKSKKLSFYLNCHTAVHCVASIYDTSRKPEFEATEKQIEVISSTLDWVDENTEYNVFYPHDLSTPGAGAAHSWVFKQYDIMSLIFEVLSQDYEPGYEGGGPHDSLVHWMKASIPVLIYLVSNIGDFYNWDNPSVEPVLNEVTPPKPI